MAGVAATGLKVASEHGDTDCLWTRLLEVAALIDLRGRQFDHFWPKTISSSQSKTVKIWYRK
jgi:hypothetical protein